MPKKGADGEGMEPKGASKVTMLLVAWRKGDHEALEELMERVYPELRRIAGHHIRREERGHTLQATALVNEAYMRLVDQTRVDWQDRTHFYAVASNMMRRILVDHARAKRANKRAGIHLSLHEQDALVPGPDVDVLALEEALTGLQAKYPFEAQVVELRYFGGLSIEEAAHHLGVGHATVERAWKLAKAWLFRHMSKGGSQPGGKADRA